MNAITAPPPPMPLPLPRQEGRRERPLPSLDRWLLFSWALLLTFAPLARPLPPLPVYLLDLVTVALILRAVPRFVRRAPSRRMRRYQGLFLVLMLALLPTTLDEIMRMGIVEPSYLWMRYTLAALPMLFLPQFLRTRRDLKPLIWGLILGVSASAVLGALNSLPMTGPMVRNQVFSNDYLTPPRVKLNTRMIYVEQEESVRGSTLVGGANIAGCFIVVPLAFLLSLSMRKRVWQGLQTPLYVVFALSVVATLLTYSRSSYVALASVTLLLFMFRMGHMTRRLFIPISVLGFAVVLAGVSTQFFNYEFLENKLDLEHGTNQARILAYTRPIPHVLENPSYVIRGAGRADQKVDADAGTRQAKASILELQDAEMHSVFAAMTFFRGFVAMVVLFVLYFMLIHEAVKLTQVSHRRHWPSRDLALSALACLCALWAYWAFTHFLVDRTHGWMIVFFVFGLTLALLEMAEREMLVRAQARHAAARAAHPGTAPG